MTREVLDTHQKALEINLDINKYGTIAEIGAGQETARWFFKVGGAAGTIAKAMSAYDMKVSDAIYGPSPRYVSRERLQAMLSHEYQLVVERLAAVRDPGSTFFAFANTVAARSFTRNVEGHGWLGIRFQHQPGAEPSQIIIHVHLRGKKNVQDQETLGVLGVNLVYGALVLWNEPETLLESLVDGLYPELVEVDMIDYAGPAFAQVDNRLMALRLVQRGLAVATMFTGGGGVVHAADVLYKKSVLIERSRFRPPTKFTINMLDCAHQEFLKEPEVEEDSVIVLSEMTLNNLIDGGDIDAEDFMQRVDILCALGKNVLISSFGEYYRLAAYLFRYTNRPVGIAMGVPSLTEIFNEKYYMDLPGGILESFGRMFKNDFRLYVCPCIDNKTGEIITAASFKPPEHLRQLYAYLYDNRFIRGMLTVNEEYLSIYSTDVLQRIRCGDGSWEGMVPEQVAEMIRAKCLFGCPG